MIHTACALIARLKMRTLSQNPMNIYMYNKQERVAERGEEGKRSEKDAIRFMWV